jgi:hypothetical protein
VAAVVVDPNKPPPACEVEVVFELEPKSPPEGCVGCGALGSPCGCGADVVVVDEPNSPPVPGVRAIDAPPNNEPEAGA